MIRDEITCRAAIIVEERAREKRRLAKIDRRDYWNEHRIRMRKRSPEQITKIADALDPIYKSGEKAMNLYNCVTANGGYRITKFTHDYEVESSYIVSADGCDCPAGSRPVCRHRTMLPFFIDGEHIDDGWFFIWDTRQWLRPVGEAETVAEQNQDWKLRPQGAPSTSNPHDEPREFYPGELEDLTKSKIGQPTNEFVELVTQANDIADEIEQADPGLAMLAQPAPPTEPTPIAPQTEPASVEGAGFKFRRPRL
jgi:hypothetical protein